MQLNSRPEVQTPMFGALAANSIVESQEVSKRTASWKRINRYDFIDLPALYWYG
jgi:hypothetical protein